MKINKTVFFVILGLAAVVNFASMAKFYSAHPAHQLGFLDGAAFVLTFLALSVFIRMFFLVRRNNHE